MMFNGWLMFIVVFFVGYMIYSGRKDRLETLRRDVAELKKQLTQTQYELQKLERVVAAQRLSTTNDGVQSEVASNLTTPEYIAPEHTTANQYTVDGTDDLQINPALDDALDEAIETLQLSHAPVIADTVSANSHIKNTNIKTTNNEANPRNDFLNSSISSISSISPISPIPPISPIEDDTNLIASQTDPATSEHANSVNPTATQSAHKPSLAEPDERSIPIVTSLLKSAKNWFFGGNLVVRVGVIVLLMGVVLLLRLLSDYIEIPITVKLLAIGIAGLSLAGLGLKLVAKRFTYGITLQGAGLAIAYLSSFFAYRVYHVLPSFPSFVLLGVLSLITVGLAVRQNAFPLALLAFSGAFLAPILASDDTGSLTALFGYYLLLNVGIAIIAHYRTWKVLNLLGASVTFALAYYWGFSDMLSAEVEAQRWSLSVIVGLHWLLYLFIAIRYAQQILAYNESITITDMLDEVDVMGRKVLFPIDTGLMFATPLLAFGLMSALLHDIEHALSVVSAIMATTYIVVGWMLIKRSRHHALLSEGLLALGFGFLALIVPLELDAEWVSFGWSVQGLALVWFGRRSLRAWAVIFGILLQTIAIIALLPDAIQFYDSRVSLLALAISAVSFMASMFVLRDANSPIDTTSPQDKALLPFVANQSMAFNVVWRTPLLMTMFTLGGMLWTVLVTVSLINAMVNIDTLTDAGLICFTMLSNMTLYWLINRYRYWEEVSWLAHGLFAVYCLSFISVLPESYMVRSVEDVNNLGVNWFEFLPLLLGWLIVGQLWIKEWVQDYQNSLEDTAHNSTLNNTKTASKISALLDYIQPTLWLGGIIIIIAQLAHYLLPDSHEVMTVIITSVSLLAIITLAKRVLNPMTPWFNWRGALMGTSILFTPIILGWAVISNVYHDGVVWGLPYIPVLNLYDIAIILALAYGAGLYLVYGNKTQAQGIQSRAMLRGLAGIGGAVGIWIISSILVRILHTYAGSPLWINGAILDDRVQICLTIFWSVTLLFSAHKLPRIKPAFAWHNAIVASSYVFIPCMFIWIILSNWYYDGVVWGLPYIPVLNLYDIAIILALAYGLRVHYLTANENKGLIYDNILLKVIGIIGFWVLSSILVRTLHTYVGTPLWSEGAWRSDKVQTGLTMLWTLTALLATVMSSRNGKRFWWFMGIGLLGLVVLKLVLVDLSQTSAIWRVISFIGAGALMMLIGYLAPLPPEEETNNLVEE